MIVVTAPTGSIGRQVVSELLARRAPVRVVARDPSKLPPAVRERADVVQGSHGDLETCERAFARADAVFWLPPPRMDATSMEAVYQDFTRPACEVFRRGGVGRVVGVSALGRGTPMAARAGQVTASLAMDDMIAATGVPYRALAMPTFMDNLLRQVEPIRKEGVFFSPIDPDLKAPCCAVRDIVSTAVKLLPDTSWGGQGHVAVLGPEDLSPNDMAAILSEVLGKPVRYQQVTVEALQAQLRGRGVTEAVVQAYGEMMQAKNEGMDNAEPRTPENSTPTSFRQWCEEVLKPALAG